MCIGSMLLHTLNYTHAVLQLLDDHQNVIPMPPPAKGTLRLVSFPPEALMPRWSLSPDRRNFLVKLKGQAGQVKIGLVDNPRAPLLRPSAAERHLDSGQVEEAYDIGTTEVARS